MVECSPATRAARVRFPADANFFAYTQAQNLGELNFNKFNPMSKYHRRSYRASLILPFLSKPESRHKETAHVGYFAHPKHRFWYRLKARMHSQLPYITTSVTNSITLVLCCPVSERYCRFSDENSDPTPIPT